MAFEVKLKVALALAASVPIVHTPLLYVVPELGVKLALVAPAGTVMFTDTPLAAVAVVLVAVNVSVVLAPYTGVVLEMVPVMATLVALTT